MSLSEFDYEQMKARTEKARDPAHYAAIQAAKAEKWQAGQEAEFQKEVENYCRLHGFYCLRPPMHKRSQLPLGYPDLTIMRDGQVLLLECKAKGGVISADQAACHLELRAANVAVYVVFGLKEAIDIIRKHWPKL